MADDGVSWSSTAGGGEYAARRVLVATGAMERPFPVAGWTLPGVMTAGAAQILLKTTGTVADDVVFVGCGPLLYLIVCQYLRAGVRVRAVLDTTDAANRGRALRHLSAARSAPSYLAKGLRLLAKIRHSGVPYHHNVSEIVLSGDDGLRRVNWRDRDGNHTLDCDHAFLHQGVIPNVNMTMATNCAHRWDEAQLCWRPVLDEHGRTSKAWLLVAGDGGGIAGARSAELSGEIAALAISADLGRLDASDHARKSAPLLAARRRDQLVRPFLDRLYRPADALRVPTEDDVVVCRCEEVRRRDLAAAIAEGCTGPNQLKSFTRAGMGPCQGRMCGNTVVEMISSLRGQTPAESAITASACRLSRSPLARSPDCNRSTREKHSHEQAETNRVRRRVSRGQSSVRRHQGLPQPAGRQQLLEVSRQRPEVAQAHMGERQGSDGTWRARSR